MPCLESCSNLSFGCPSSTISLRPGWCVFTFARSFCVAGWGMWDAARFRGMSWTPLPGMISLGWRGGTCREFPLLRSSPRVWCQPCVPTLFCTLWPIRGLSQTASSTRSPKVQKKSEFNRQYGAFQWGHGDRTTFVSIAFNLALGPASARSADFPAGPTPGPSGGGRQCQPTAWWVQAYRMVAQNGATAWWHNAHCMVAQYPLYGGTRPTTGWHKADRMVAQDPPHGGIKPIARWHKAHLTVAQAHREMARQSA